jgi:hypothetical protein
MDSKLYLTIVAVLGVLYGIMFVLFPSDAVAFYGVTGQPTQRTPLNSSDRRSSPWP